MEQGITSSLQEKVDFFPISLGRGKGRLNPTTLVGSKISHFVRFYKLHGNFIVISRRLLFYFVISDLEYCSLNFVSFSAFTING